MKLSNVLFILLLMLPLLCFGVQSNNKLITPEKIEFSMEAPDRAALYIIQHSLKALKSLRKRASIDEIRILLRNELEKNINIESAAEFALRPYWNNIIPEQKQVFKQYIFKSIIDDYANIFFIGSNDLSDIEFNIDAIVRRKGNKAIVTFMAQFNADSKPIPVSVRMINIDKRWKIYDLMFSGISLMKGYRAKFNSQIKRKGLDAVILKLSNTP